jgi:DNA-binding response OmpR family regulator
MKQREEQAGLILLIEDNRGIAEMVGEFLERRGYGLDYASDGVTGLHLAVSNSYDVIVLDLMLPGMDGLELCRKLRRDAKKSTPVLMLTARDTLEDKLTGLDAGADDYLVKPFDPRELLLRIATILRRATPPALSPGPLRFGPFRFDADGAVLWRGEERVHLTDAELSLLQVLAEQPGVPVGREELGRRSRVSGSDRAIDTQIARLRRKLEPDPRRPHHLLTKRGEGYVLKPGG